MFIGLLLGVGQRGGNMLTSTSVTNAATLDVALPNGATVVAIYLHYTGHTDAQVPILQVSDDDAATFEASSYEWGNAGENSADSTPPTVADTSAETADAARIRLSSAGLDVGSSAARGFCALLLTDHETDGTHKNILYHSSQRNSAGDGTHFTIGGAAWVGGTGALTHLRFAMTSGNITATAHVEAIS